MNNVAGLTVFFGGIVLLIFGLDGSQPVKEAARVLSGTSRTQAGRLILGGSVAVLAGLILAVRNSRT